MPQTTPPPGVSYDGRAQTSRFWGPKTAKVRMCPHRLPHKDVIPEPGGRGLQCGLTPDRCMCVYLLCQAPMRARKRCGTRHPDGSICPWGQDRSDEESSPEQSPEVPKAKRPRPWYLGAAPAPAAGPALVVETPLPNPAPAPRRVEAPLPLPNLEPGGPDAPMPGARPPRTQFANRTPTRRPKAVMRERRVEDLSFELDDDLLLDFVAPPPCHPPNPHQGE